MSKGLDHFVVVQSERLGWARDGLAAHHPIGLHVCSGQTQQAAMVCLQPMVLGFARDACHGWSWGSPGRHSAGVVVEALVEPAPVVAEQRRVQVVARDLRLTGGHLLERLVAEHEGRGACTTRHSGSASCEGACTSIRILSHQTQQCRVWFVIENSYTGISQRDSTALGGM